jgi:pimeloyl-ACP methyl ester carboxylesterase
VSIDITSIIITMGMLATPREESGVARTEVLAELREIRLEQVVVRYREVWEGAPIVFVHGLPVKGGLWREVVPALSGRLRCIVPDLPLGSHAVPLVPGADLTLPGLVRIILGFLDARRLRDVTLVGNDTGGAICQLVVARHSDHVARLVLTNRDTFENFLPPLLRPFQHGARVPGFAFAVAQLMRTGLGRRALVATVARHIPEPPVLDSYFAPMMQNPGVRHDITKVLRGISDRYTLEAASTFRDFCKPVLLVWGEDTSSFRSALPSASGRRSQTPGSSGSPGSPNPSSGCEPVSADTTKRPRLRRCGLRAAHG